MSSVDTTGIQINLTDAAVAEVRKFFEVEQLSPQVGGLRVVVLPGGCSGFKYSLNLEEQAQEDDIVLEARDVRMFVDGFSLQYLNGVKIDYVTSMQGSGFTFENPNATGGCGCGTSFTA